MQTTGTFPALYTKGKPSRKGGGKGGKKGC